MGSGISPQFFRFSYDEERSSKDAPIKNGNGVAVNSNGSLIMWSR